jgi:uncharacterized membrane protein YphA (DoxX/SURF4 family)
MHGTADMPTNRFDNTVYKVFIVLARIGLGYLFFTQLFWKLPPSFGCGANYAFPVATEQNYYDTNNSSGLCFWMGVESIFASQPRKILIADMRPAGLPAVSISITPLAKINGFLLDHLFIPQIRIFGWLVWLTEFSVFLTMIFGLFTRLGALAAIGISLQLYIGLANVPRPFEWEWTYGAIVALAFAMMATAPGRVFGVDTWLRRKLAGPAKQGNVFAKIGLILS